LSLLPDPLRQGEIHFIFAKKLPYGKRLRLILLSICCGILIQLFISFWIGLIFLILGTGLSLIKGCSAKPEIIGEEEWRQVTPDEYKKVKKKQETLKEWDKDAFDITNPLGIFVFCFLAIFFLIIWFLIDRIIETKIAFYFALNAFVIFVPHWFTGVRSFLKKDKLILKIDLLQEIMEFLGNMSEIHVLPMLSIKETRDAGKVPTDARLMVRFLNTPESFLGMQIQIAINTVQGHDYPYLYCVLIGKKGEGLFDKRPYLKNTAPPNIVFEKSSPKDVDIIVIRQQTTKQTGYHTNKRKSLYIVETALILARKYLK